MAKYKRSKKINYPKGYAPFTTVKPKSKLRRTLYELIHGAKAYMPRDKQTKKEMEQISREARILRKKQAEIYGKKKK